VSARIDPELAAVLASSIARPLTPAQARQLAARLRRVVEATSPATTPPERALARDLTAAADLLDAQAGAPRREGR
jgi:hypothetical protein